jgi:hypothetical protein
MDTNRLSGIVEKVGVDEKMAFHTIQELVSLVAGYISKERRLTGRLELKLPVKVEGTNALGKRFTEDTTLKDLSVRGAFFSVRNPLERNTKLRLLIDPSLSDKDVVARVVRLTKEPRASGVGVSFE